MGELADGEGYVSEEQYPLILDRFNERMAEVETAEGILLVDLPALIERSGDRHRRIARGGRPAGPHRSGRRGPLPRRARTRRPRHGGAQRRRRAPVAPHAAVPRWPGST